MASKLCYRYCISHFLLMLTSAASVARSVDVGGAAVTSDCGEKRARALALMVAGVQDVFVPACTSAGLYDNPQCYGFVGECWCCDPVTGEPLPPAAATTSNNGLPPHRFTVPNCSVHECRVPSSEHVLVSGAQPVSPGVYMTGSNVSVQCDPGYQLTGADSSPLQALQARCSGQDVWTPDISALTCQPEAQRTVIQQLVEFFNYLFGFLFGS